MGVTGFSDETKYMGARASSVILDFETILSNSYISENLQIERDTPIYYLKRLRFKNGKIVGINETYIKKIKGLNIKDSDLDENTSIIS
ncbi:MAG: UTRA domain-containing protein [Helcococcus sp.]|nr:UTRA domain-containing protein [Helcococcus sp.]